jgi:hypothetical protein
MSRKYIKERQLTEEECVYCGKRPRGTGRRGNRLASCGELDCKRAQRAEAKALERGGADPATIRARYRVIVPQEPVQPREEASQVTPGQADVAGEAEPDWWAAAVRAAADGDREALRRLYAWSWTGLWVEFLLSKGPDDDLTREDQDRLRDMCKEEGWL